MNLTLLPNVKTIVLLIGVVVIAVTQITCRNNKAASKDGGYPKEVAAILLTKCAISGCHTTQDKSQAAGLDLSTWAHLFEGTEEPENVCIPYHPNESHLFLHTNTYSDLGDSHGPVMPATGEPLSRAEIQVLYDWIQAGAPNEKGEIPFSDQPNREKVYVTNQGCDNVSVIDAATGMLIRIVEVGTQSAIESPHAVRVSPDKKYWYVAFAKGSVIQKMDAASDKLISSIEISYGSWNQLIVSPDGRTGFALDYSNNGRIAFLDLENGVLKKMYSGNGLFVLPHGLTASSDFKTLYITTSTGNFIYKMDVSDPMNPALPISISMTTGESPNFNSASNLGLHDIRFLPDGKDYVITCSQVNQIRFYQTTNDSLVKTIAIGQYPQEIAFSKNTPYLLVSCMEDAACSGTPCKGSIAVLNYQTKNLVKSIANGYYEPHGVVVDDARSLLYIANRNVTSVGVPAHHGSECAGNNGYLNTIDLITLQPTDFNLTLSVDSYNMDIR